MSQHHFFAVVSRMKYIERWALMRSTRSESLSEHSLEVAMIAHVLCVIGNLRYGKHLSAEDAAVIALYHDSSEIITGDMPTPVKYFSQRLHDAYKQVESGAEERLLQQLPDDLQEYYRPYIDSSSSLHEQLYAYVKAADKLSALIKCIEEESAGNTEFKTAYATTLHSLQEMEKTMPEVHDFMQEFLPSYGKTLDELLDNGGE
jgi:5'-deoxynucleotidase